MLWKLLAAFAATIWGITLSVAIQKGWADSVPDELVLCGFAFSFLIYVGVALSSDHVRSFVATQRMLISLPTFLLVFLLIGLGAWAVVRLIGHRPKSEAITTENVDKYVKEWVEEFPKNFSNATWKEGEPNPQLYFGYRMTFGDGRGVGVSRSREPETSQVIALSSMLTLAEEALTEYVNLSPQQKRYFARELGTEATRSSIHIGNPDDLTQPMKIRDDLPINDNLTKDVFYNAVRDVHSKLNLVRFTLERLFDDVKKSSSPTSSATPNQTGRRKRKPTPPSQASDKAKPQR